MFNGLKLSKELTWRKLPNGSVVVYNPKGFARPFVVTELALYIFECIKNSVRIDTKVTPLESVVKILNVFEKEKIISGWKNSDQETAKDTINKTIKGKKVSLWIHTTDLCNLRCKGCYIIKGKSVISDETIKNIAKYVKNEAEKNNLKTLNLKFAGGEPLIAFDQVERTVGTKTIWCKDKTINNF
jgi:sulfatase maturation enzyme AslB (radical SAM superfamily)